MFFSMIAYRCKLKRKCVLKVGIVVLRVARDLDVIPLLKFSQNQAQMVKIIDQRVSDLILLFHKRLSYKGYCCYVGYNKLRL